MLRRSRFLAVSTTRGMLAVALLFAAACQQSEEADDLDLRSDDVTLTAGLETVAQCDQLLDRLVAEGLEAVGPYGFGEEFGWLGLAEFAEDDMEDDSAASSGSSLPSGATGTNNQEVGVDEPDIVKSDGQRLVATGSSQIMVLDVSGATPAVERTIPIPGENWEAEVFLIGDTIFVTTNGYTEVALSDGILPRHGGMDTTRVHEIDLNTGETRRVLEVEGRILSAREIDGTLRFVFSSPAINFPFLFPSNPEATEAAEAANRKVIEDSTIAQWLPSYALTEGDTTLEQGQLVPCDRMYLPPESSGFGTISVLTVDANNGLAPLDAVGVLTNGETIYASTDRLTVATQQLPQWNGDWGIEPEEGATIDQDEEEPVEPDDDFTVSLHNFDITDPTTTTYTASGNVEGHLLNRYSLSEYEGVLRVATTAGSPWNQTGEQTESFVTTLRENNGSLETIGKVGGLGLNESIQAVRFVGPIGFVVTFRQIDPLYTIDLSDPTNPTTLGELKVTGYSAYLHNIGDGKILGIGQDADTDGIQLGAQASVFDVSNLNNPSLLNKLNFGSESWSAVEHEPRAFTWLAEQRLAITPIDTYNWDEETDTDNSGSAAVVLAISEDGTLSERGRIHQDPEEFCEEFGPEGLVEDEESTQPAPERFCWNIAPSVQRAVVVGEVVYTTSEVGVQANQLSSLEKTAWFAFEG